MKKTAGIPVLGFTMLVLIAVIIMAARPFSGDLSGTGHLMFGGILITLGIWIFKPFKLPYAAGGLFLAVFALILGLAPNVVFAGFAQPAIWTLIPALFFGYTLQKTGLGKRIALGIVKLFKPSYASLVFAWVLIGIALSVLTPSITVRVAIVIPIALQCCELLKLKKGSKGNSLILLTAFAMALVPGSGWLSGLLGGPIIQGMYNAIPALYGLVTFNSWFAVLFIPMMIVTLLIAVGSLIIFRPEERISSDVARVIKEQKMPKPDRQEIITVIILTIVFLMFLTSSLHGLPDAAVCLAAVFAFFLFGVIESKDFSAGINWDLVIFIGMAIGLGAVFAETGISAWLSGIVVPLLGPIAGNPWIFMFVVMIAMFAWRFVDVAILIPTMAILIPILPDIQARYQIHPMIWVAVLVMATNAFFMTYQNIWATMSVSMSGDRAWSNKHMSIYGILYFAACLLTLFVAVPMWINSGLFQSF